jgi:hypothetical protein
MSRVARQPVVRVERTDRYAEESGSAEPAQSSGETVDLDIAVLQDAKDLLALLLRFRKTQMDGCSSDRPP